MQFSRTICAFMVSVAVFATSTIGSAQGKVDWTPLLKDALEQAKAQNRIVFVSMGAVGEARSEQIRKAAFSQSGLVKQTQFSFNVPAWSVPVHAKRKLPAFGKASQLDHHENLVECMDRWLAPNLEDAIALPQHLWIDGDGKLLLSCPWELSAEEFSWCFQEAFRLAEIKDAAPAIDGAHPPRRLLLGEVFELPADDTLGRGLMESELEEMIKRLNKRFLAWSDAGDVGRITFSDFDEAVEFVEQQIGFWEIGGSRAGPIINGSLGIIGNLSTSRFLELLKKYAARPNATTRGQVAVAIEQIGHPDGAALAKNGLKKESDDAVRAEWVRALGACGRNDKTTGRSLIKLAQKDKDARVRLNAILALGHVLPDPGARSFLLDLAELGGGEEQLAAVLALGLGRDRGSVDLLTKLSKDDPGDVLKTHVELVLRVLNGANLYELEVLFKNLDGSSFDRKRLFFRGKAAN
ncbi:MAG: HEAT repeat domain-containing protein [Planctomycetes bacterium]|nr:HEAT repeat domain-containing protein [Planctomycetota bacterium]